MKNICLIISVTLLLAVSSFCQTDSIMYIKETDFSFYRMQKVKYESTGEIKMEKQLVTLEDVRKLTFLSKDSLALSKHAGAPVYTSLSYINDVRKYKYRFSPVLGAVIGFVGGGLVGGIIGYGFSPGGSYAELRVIGQALVGAVVGGILGAVYTGFVINHPTLDLFSIADKDKKNELIKFLRHNK